MIAVDYMVLADAAAVAEGKHYIHGGGWASVIATEFPTTCPQMAVAIRLVAPQSEAAQTVDVELDVLDDLERSILPAPPGAPRGKLLFGHPPAALGHVESYMPIVFNLATIQFPTMGVYSFVVRLDGAETKRTRIVVLSAPVQAATGASDESGTR